MRTPSAGSTSKSSKPKRAPKKQTARPAPQTGRNSSAGLTEPAHLERLPLSHAALDDEYDWLDETAETLPDLEREIGISDWIDPQTGEPAEGQSPPHLEEE
jgi:hypothetical protein